MHLVSILFTSMHIDGKQSHQWPLPCAPSRIFLKWHNWKRILHRASSRGSAEAMHFRDGVIFTSVFFFKLLQSASKPWTKASCRSGVNEVPRPRVEYRTICLETIVIVGQAEAVRLTTRPIRVCICTPDYTTCSSETRVLISSDSRTNSSIDILKEISHGHGCLKHLRRGCH